MARTKYPDNAAGRALVAAVPDPKHIWKDSGSIWVFTGADIPAPADIQPIIQLDPDYSEGIRAHAMAAAVTLKPTGGVIQFPAGIYEVWGLPIFPGITYRGVGFGTGYLGGPSVATKLVLPASPTDHMFVAKYAADDAAYGITDTYIAGFSIENLEVDGRQLVSNMDATTGYDCINMDGLNKAPGASVQRCDFRNVAATGFRCFYRNNCDLANCRDRAPCFSDICVHKCWAGIWTNEHPFYGGINSIRECTYGITGKTLYDQVISNMRIVYCGYGIAAQPGLSIQRTSIFGNMLVLNTLSIDLGPDGYGVSITDNVFSPKPDNVSTCAIRVAGQGVNKRIANNVFDSDGGTYNYTQGHIWIDNTSGACNMVHIANNSFRCRGSRVLASGGTYDFGRWTFSSNDVMFETGAEALDFCDFSGHAILYGSILGNSFRIRNNVGNGIMAKITDGDTVGLMISNNHVAADAANYAATMFEANFIRGMICDNIFRNVTNAVVVTAKDATSLPAGIAVGTTSVSTDGAAIKSRNIVA